MVKRNPLKLRDGALALRGSTLNRVYPAQLADDEGKLAKKREKNAFF